MFVNHDQFQSELALVISSSIKSIFSFDFPEEKIYSLFGPTPNREAGDLSFPLFILAKELKTNPAQAAKTLSESPLKWPDFVSKVSSAGPYLNFYFDFNKIAQTLIPQINSGEFFKKKLTQNTPKTMIEFSQPNTHKELHVGHMRNLCLGDSLIRLHRYSGFEIVSTTFPGDVGTHVAKCLWFLKFHYQGEIPSERKGAWLGSLYTAGNNLLEEQRGTDQEAKNREQLTLILKQLEQKSGEYYELWKETREWSIELMNEVYKWADVTFDVWYWESEVDSDSVKTARKYFESGLFKEDNGCIGIDLSEYKLGFCMILKTDGNGLYATKDIELARRKFQDFQIEKSIYIVDKRQEHHFKQVFKTLELMGFEQAKNCLHLQYDFVELPDGAMSSRKGNIVPLQSLIDNMVTMIKEQYLTRYKDEWSKEEIEETAQLVAKGAIKYGMTRIDPSRKIVFDMSEWLKLDGESGPYAQYVCARINSMLKKLGPATLREMNIQEKQESELVAILMRFNHAVELATTQYKPSALTAYIYDLSRAFNSFYAECPLASAEESIKASRIHLTNAVSKTLKIALELLGIKTPERM